MLISAAAAAASPSHEFAVKPAKKEVCLAGDPFNSAAATARALPTDSSESHCYSIFKAKFEGIMAATQRRPEQTAHTFHASIREVFGGHSQ